MAVLLAADEVLDEMVVVKEVVIAAVVDGVVELVVVVITEVEVVLPTADDVPGTHWTRIGRCINTSCAEKVAVIPYSNMNYMMYKQRQLYTQWSRYTQNPRIAHRLAHLLTR